MRIAISPLPPIASRTQPRFGLWLTETVPSPNESYILQIGEPMYQKTIAHELGHFLANMAVARKWGFQPDCSHNQDTVIYFSPDGHVAYTKFLPGLQAFLKQKESNFQPSEEDDRIQLYRDNIVVNTAGYFLKALVFGEKPIPSPLEVTDIRAMKQWFVSIVKHREVADEVILKHFDVFFEPEEELAKERCNSLFKDLGLEKIRKVHRAMVASRQIVWTQGEMLRLLEQAGIVV